MSQEEAKGMKSTQRLNPRIQAVVNTDSYYSAIRRKTDHVTIVLAAILQYFALMIVAAQGSKPALLTLCSIADSKHSRGSTVERVVDLQGEEGRTEEETTAGHTANNPSYGTGQAASDYPATSEQYSAQSYYAPTQASTNDWPQQDQQWNNQYSASTTATYDATYYGSAGVPVATTNYHQNYYSGTYTGYSSQDGWLAPTGDPRAFVGSGTTYDNLNDLPIDPSRRNAELNYFCEPETDNP